jgi:hypothetical protein
MTGEGYDSHEVESWWRGIMVWVARQFSSSNSY